MGRGRKGREGEGEGDESKIVCISKKTGRSDKKRGDWGGLDFWGEILGGAWGDPQKYPQAKKKYRVRRNLSTHGSKVAIIGLVQQ